MRRRRFVRSLKIRLFSSGSPFTVNALRNLIEGTGLRLEQVVG